MARDPSIRHDECGHSIEEKFGLRLVLPSTRFTQCQVSIRRSLAKSSNKNICKIHKVSSKNVNIQYDQYLSTEDALEKNRSMSEKRLINDLATQILFIYFKNLYTG